MDEASFSCSQGVGDLFCSEFLPGFCRKVNRSKSLLWIRTSISPLGRLMGRKSSIPRAAIAHDWILWRISASGSGKPKPLPFSGEGMTFDPAISLNNHRLVYVLMSWDINIWRCQIPKGEEKPAPPSRLVGSTRVQEEPNTLRMANQSPMWPGRQAVVKSGFATKMERTPCS